MTLLGAWGVLGQSPTAQESEQKSEQKEKKPPPPDSNSKKPSPQGAEKLGQGLKLSESSSFREAPLTEGGRGGYSSAMGVPEAAPSNANVEEKAIEGLLLDSPRWRVGPHGLIERGEPGGQWRARASVVETDLNAVWFANRWVGWIVGDKGTILRTEDEGKAWRKVPFATRTDLLNVRGEDWKSARVTGRSGTVYVTRDGGATWSVAPRPAGPRP